MRAEVAVAQPQASGEFGNSSSAKADPQRASGLGDHAVDQFKSLSSRGAQQHSAGPKSVRFSCEDGDSEDDAVLDRHRERDALAEGGAAWKTLTEFDRLKEIYRGHVSLVASARCKKSLRDVVIKAYIKAKLSPSMLEMIYREIRLHGQMSGTPGFVLFLGWFEDEVQIVLILENCEGGDLYRHLVLNGGQMSEQEAVQVVLYPLLKGLYRLHTCGIAHRDLKPENIFFAGNSFAGEDLRIGDLGLATDLVSMRDRVGTLDYMAPEIMLQKDESHFSDPHLVAANSVLDGDDVDSTAPPLAQIPDPYTSQVDVWAVGAIAFELITGRPPFEVAKAEETAMLIVWGKVKYPDCVSVMAQQFINAALTKDPKARPTVPQLLQHPFVLSHRRLDQTSSESLHWYQNRASFKVAGSRANTAASTAVAAPSLNSSTLPTVTNGMLDYVPSTPKHRAPVKSKSVRVIKATSGSFSQQPASPASPRKPQASQPRALQSLTRSQPRGQKSTLNNAPVRQPIRTGLRFSDDSIPESDIDSALRISKPVKTVQVKKTVRLSDTADSEPCSSGSATPARRRSNHRGGSKPSGILKNNRFSDDSVEGNTMLGPADSAKEQEMRRRQSSGELMRRFMSSMILCVREPQTETHETPCQSEGDSNRSNRISGRKPSDGDSAGSGPASKNSRRGSRSRGVSRTPSRLNFNLSRLVSRFFEEPAPWNTSAAHLQKANDLVCEPDAELLDNILRGNGEINRKRYMEYVMRRGWESKRPMSRELAISDAALKELQQIASRSAPAADAPQQSDLVDPSPPVFLESINFSTPLETIECSPTRSPSVSDAGVDLGMRRISLQLSLTSGSQEAPALSPLASKEAQC